MNKEFLNKVVYHIVKETRMDFTKGKVYTPYLPSSPLMPLFSCYFPLHLDLVPSFSSYPSPLFSEHCENVYGLNNEEMDYVWKEYKDIIDNKIIKELA